MDNVNRMAITGKDVSILCFDQCSLIFFHDTHHLNRKKFKKKNKQHTLSHQRMIPFMTEVMIMRPARVNLFLRFNIWHTRFWQAVATGYSVHEDSQQRHKTCKFALPT